MYSARALLYDLIKAHFHLNGNIHVWTEMTCSALLGQGGEQKSKGICDWRQAKWAEESGGQGYSPSKIYAL